MPLNPLPSFPSLISLFLSVFGWFLLFRWSKTCPQSKDEQTTVINLWHLLVRVGNATTLIELISFYKMLWMVCTPLFLIILNIHSLMNIHLFSPHQYSEAWSQHSLRWQHFQINYFQFTGQHNSLEVKWHKVIPCKFPPPHPTPTPPITLLNCTDTFSSFYVSLDTTFALFFNLICVHLCTFDNYSVLHLRFTCHIVITVHSVLFLHWLQPQLNKSFWHIICVEKRIEDWDGDFQLWKHFQEMCRVWLNNL